MVECGVLLLYYLNKLEKGCVLLHTGLTGYCSQRFGIIRRGDGNVAEVMNRFSCVRSL